MKETLQFFLVRNRPDLAAALLIWELLRTVPERVQTLKKMRHADLQMVYEQCLAWLDCCSFAHLFLAYKIQPKIEIGGEMLKFMALRYEELSAHDGISAFEQALMRRFLVEWGEAVALEEVSRLRTIFGLNSQELTSMVWAAPLENEKEEALPAKVIPLRRKA